MRPCSEVEAPEEGVLDWPEAVQQLIEQGPGAEGEGNLNWCYWPDVKIKVMVMDDVP